MTQSDMMQLKLPAAIKLVHQAAILMNEPVALWGPAGVGKTEGISALVDRIGAVMCDIRLGQYDSVDMRGFPGIDPKTGLTIWHAPSTMPFIGNDAWPDDRIIVMFLDEISSATMPVAGNAYQLVNEGRLGEHVLKPNVRIVAAGNREGDRGVVNRSPKPLMNRFTHAEVVPDVEALCHWLQDNGYPGVGIAFLQFRPDLIDTFDASSPAKAFATPRTWAKAFNYWASDMDPETKAAAQAGAVGMGPAAEFGAFTQVWSSMIPIKDIIADPKKAPVPTEPSMCYAVAVNVSGNMNADTVTPLSAYLDRMEPDFAVLAWTLATRRDKKLTLSHEFQHGYAQRIAPIVTSR